MANNKVRNQIKRADPKTPGRKPGRIKSFKQPKPGIFRRFFRLVFNPLTLSLAGLLTLGVVLALTYFWFEYSDRIDRVLRGDVFTNTAGIYSAPKTIRESERFSLDELQDYLKSAGYIEKNQQADQSRSRFVIDANSVKIEPGLTAVIDDVKKYPALLIKFKKDKKSVESITDEDLGQNLQHALLEPKILSSITAEGDGKRRVITFRDLPPDLVKAITVTEDRAFFEHYGVNFRGIGRALWRRYDGENDDSPIAQQGGSSITQQLVKNLLLNRDKTLERKAKEAYMSIILETRLSKEEIFTLYANQIYLGQQSGMAIYGVGQASMAYFAKDVSQLTLPEAAFLAGIIRSPNRYNPYKRLERVTERRNQVLDSMVEAGAISRSQADEAKSFPLTVSMVSSEKDLMGMPYFSQFAVEEVPKIVSDPEALQHLRVYTTIDPDLQKIAYEIVNKRLDRLDKYFPKRKKGDLQAALVAIRPKTGEIVAMVGGRDYLETQFNRATDAKRQPGSVFKPFVYAAGINTAYDASARVLTAASVFKDEKKTFTYAQESYSPNNYGDSFSGQELTLRDSLVKSKNVITVDLAMELNIGKVMNFAAKAGLPKVSKAYPSMALGTSEATPLEIATGYTSFANLGERTLPAAISRVTSGEGKTLVAPTPDRKMAMRPNVAYIVNDMLKDVINRGTAAEAKGWGFRNVEGKTAFAGKTGTSRDGWFAGYTPELVCVVYVGFDDNSDLGMKGSDSAMPIWADFMREALNIHPDWNGDWAMPDGIQKAEIDIRTGKMIKDLSLTESTTAQTEPTPAAPNPDPALDPDADTEVSAEKQIYVTDIPPEFRRVELFISGTLPNKNLLPADEINNETDSESTTPNGSPTPFTTWENAHQDQPDAGSPETGQPAPPEKTVTIWVCEYTGMKAGEFCPRKKRKIVKESEQDQATCTFHLYPPD